MYIIGVIKRARVKFELMCVHTISAFFAHTSYKVSRETYKWNK